MLELALGLGAADFSACQSLRFKNPFVAECGFLIRLLVFSGIQLLFIAVRGLIF